MKEPVHPGRWIGEGAEGVPTISAPCHRHRQCETPYLPLHPHGSLIKAANAQHVGIAPEQPTFPVSCQVRLLGFHPQNPILCLHPLALKELRGGRSHVRRRQGADCCSRDRSASMLPVSLAPSSLEAAEAQQEVDDTGALLPACSSCPALIPGGKGRGVWGVALE